MFDLYVFENLHIHLFIHIASAKRLKRGTGKRRLLQNCLKFRAGNISYLCQPYLSLYNTLCYLV